MTATPSNAPTRRRERRQTETLVVFCTAQANRPQAARRQPLRSPRPYPHAVKRPLLAVFPHGL